MFKNLFFKNKVDRERHAITTDIHSHLIPGIDDGAETTEQSVQMIEQLVSLGYTHLITTPHIMWDSYKNVPEGIRRGLENLRDACTERGIRIRLDAAAEYFIDEHFLELLRGEKEMLTLPGNRLLVELPYSTPLLNTTETLFSIVGYGYIPVLAHPERYNYFHSNMEVYRKLKEQGCELQLNALSLSRYYGTEVQKVALWLLKQKLITFLGTDAHHIQHVAALRKTLELRVLQDYKFSNNQISLIG